MNREIKFRGKRVDTGEWVYGYYIRIQNDDSSYTHYIQEDTTRHIKNVSQTLYEVTPESVGQYTGLKDKNGKEIYEGDIVRCQTPSDYTWGEEAGNYFIGFNNGTFCLYRNIHDACEVRQWNDGTHDWYSIENVDCIEIISNIYENPELLNS